MARILDQVRGQQEIVDRFFEAHHRGQLPSTLLLTGPEGVGRKTLARGFAQALCCSEDPRGCGVCGSCLRIEKNQSESVLTVAAEKSQIKMEQAREILHFLNLRILASHRVILIENAEQMNIQTANALLKIFEEPPPQTLFFLIARSPRHVLPTIRSRAVHVPFRVLPRQERMIQDSEIDSSEGNWLETSLEMLMWWMESSQAYLRPAFRERIKDRRDAIQIARNFQGFFRDIEFLRMGIEEPLSFPRQRELFKKVLLGFQKNPDGNLDSETLVASRASKVFDLAVSLERDLEGGSRDALLCFEAFWIRSQMI